MAMIKFFVLLSVLFCVSGCQRHYLSITQQIVNRDLLASTHVATPDPRQANPPLGRRLIISWQVPSEIVEKEAQIHLDVIYWNYTEESFTFPVKKRKGEVLLSLLGQEFDEKKGFLTYKACIKTKEGEIYREWKQQLWVELIHTEEPQ